MIIENFQSVLGDFIPFYPILANFFYFFWEKYRHLSKKSFLDSRAPGRQFLIINRKPHHSNIPAFNHSNCQSGDLSFNLSFLIFSGCQVKNFFFYSPDLHFFFYPILSDFIRFYPILSVFIRFYPILSNYFFFILKYPYMARYLLHWH